MRIKKIDDLVDNCRERVRRGLTPSLHELFALSFILSLFFAIGCEDTPSGSSDTTGPTVTIICDESADSYFLQSKYDDDDGDGNPRDEDFPTINDEDDDIADHAWIKDSNGVYHLFFHNEYLGTPEEIEHYTSFTLGSLDYVGLALKVNPNGWDSHGLWAPHVIKHRDTYFMFYTGVDGRGPGSRQRIGLATSTDLVTWTRYPINNCPGTSGDGCLYECDECWTTWGGPLGSANQQCRDPFVIWDALYRRWVMLATAKSTNQFGVVTVAYSTDLINWTGAGFIDATRRLASGAEAQTTGGQAENPHVVTYNKTHYLFFTDWQDPEDSVSVHDPRTIAQYATSSTLNADTLGSANWTYRGYIPDPGINAIEVQRYSSDIWIMSQSIANERSSFWHLRRELRLKCIIWGNDFTFDTSNVTFRSVPAGRAAGSSNRGRPIPVSTAK